MLEIVSLSNFKVYASPLSVIHRTNSHFSRTYCFVHLLPPSNIHPSFLACGRFSSITGARSCPSDLDYGGDRNARHSIYTGCSARRFFAPIYPTVVFIEKYWRRKEEGSGSAIPPTMSSRHSQISPWPPPPLLVDVRLLKNSSPPLQDYIRGG